MTFLQNCWYAASWSHDLSDVPVSLTVLDQPIVLFRGAGGDPAALQDACPHRFAPLSMGRVSGERLVCPYHGLEFERTERCGFNPHGKGQLPDALAVRTYPLIERFGMLWIWMGESEEADHALIPALPGLIDPDFSWVYGSLRVEVNYELVVDNLLDLSHVEFLHPFLASCGNASRTKFRAEQTNDLVSAYYDISGEPISGLFELLWDGAATHGEMHAYMHWLAPSNLYLDVGMRHSGQTDDEAALIPTVHLLSPAGEDATHYFWAAGRNRCMVTTGFRKCSGMALNLHLKTKMSR